MLNFSEYERLRARPIDKPVMTQKWRSLLFMHFPVNPSEIQDHLPPGLIVDTYPDETGREMAWIGLVPFRMEDVKFSRIPKIPGMNAFPETNVRTYVHRMGRQPGVWFFSLDAGNAIACKFARKFYHLPYFPAKMEVKDKSKTIRYKSKRKKGLASVKVKCSLGSPMPQPKPGSLEFFLLERYLLYSLNGERIMTGRVHHEPYQVESVDLCTVKETVLEASEIEAKPFKSFLFCRGVDVEVFALQGELRQL